MARGLPPPIGAVQPVDGLHYQQFLPGLVISQPSDPACGRNSLTAAQKGRPPCASKRPVVWFGCPGNGSTGKSSREHYGVHSLHIATLIGDQPWGAILCNRRGVLVAQTAVPSPGIYRLLGGPRDGGSSEAPGAAESRARLLTQGRPRPVLGIGRRDQLTTSAAAARGSAWGSVRPTGQPLSRT